MPRGELGYVVAVEHQSVEEDVLKRARKGLTLCGNLVGVIGAGDPRHRGRLHDPFWADVDELSHQVVTVEGLAGKAEGLHPFQEALATHGGVQCGFCRAGCPVFAQSGLESHNARGRVLLAYSLLSGKLEPSFEIGERLFKCTTCANCTSTCPSGIKVVDIVERVRQKMVQEGFGRPEHEKIKESIKEYHNPFGEDPKARNALLEYAGVSL